MKTSPYIALSLLLVFRAVGSYAQGDADPDWQSNQRTDDPPALGSSWVPQQMPPPPPGPVPKSPGQPSIAEANTPQIQALAQGLQNDPTRIFNFVHNYINYVLYFGSKKGAQLTLLEKSGNDFDQCALMVALLRAAGYSDAAYQFGWMQVPYDNPDGSGNDLHHWLNLSLVNTNWQNTSNYLYTLFCKCRGYPTYYFWANDTNDFCFQRVWVTFSAGGTNYCVDPAFKTAQPTNGINLASAMGFTSNVLMGAVGGTDTSRYVSGLTESALRAQMTTYTTNLLYFIRTNCPTDSVLQILGGNEPLISPQAPLANGLLFSAFQWTNAGVAEMPIVSWVNLPTNLMSTLQITFAGNVGYQWYVPQLCGDRLALTFDSAGNAQLWQEDNLLAQGSTGGAATTAVTLYINHPYGNWNLLTNGLIDTTFNDQTVTSIYQGTNATYAIIYAFEPDWGWFQQRQDQLDAYRAQGLPDTSRQVVSETLNVMGLNWLLETAWAGHIMDPQLHVLPQFHHRIGRMGQETGHGYYVDAYMQSAGFLADSGVDAVSQSHWQTEFDLWSYFASALEYGIIEQLQSTNLVGASTVKMLDIASTNNQKVYLANNANWSSVSGQLTGYTNLSDLQSFASAGYTLLLPKSGTNYVAGPTSWRGFAYAARFASSSNYACRFTIGGGYQGGYDSDPSAEPSPPAISSIDQAQPTCYTTAPALVPPPTRGDPIDMVDGTFQVDATDLSLGQPEPRGIRFSRYYNGTRRNSNPAGMAPGWVHNYYANVSAVAAPQAGLGCTTPAQAAPMIAATCAAINIYNNAQPDARNWMVTALIAKWGVDQLTRNGVSVTMGKDTLQFTKEPDGSFAPPARCTMTLTNPGNTYALTMRHGNAFDFDAAGRLASIVDPYNQSSTITYLSPTSTWPQTVTDWKGRSLTFNYSGTPQHLTSVSDSTGRTTSYIYTNAYSASGDLAQVVDPEHQTITYFYDTNHEIIATFDALNRLVVSNIYDGCGHVTSQLAQGSANKVWQIFWSGPENVEQDPAGGQSIFCYDSYSRPMCYMDGDGGITWYYVDGQDNLTATMSPMGEWREFYWDADHDLTVAWILDGPWYSSQYTYDAQDNLIAVVDPDSNKSTFGYNAQFSLTGATNGAGNWVAYAYNSDGTLHTRTDPAGATTYSYDTLGQVSSIAYPNNLGGEGFLNGPLGDVLSHTNGNGVVTSLRYNQRRQLTNTVVNSAAATNLTASIAYDAPGNVLTTTDARQSVISNYWSTTHKLLASTYPNTPQGVPTTTNYYDNRDWPLQMQDALLHTTTFAHDAAGRRISVGDPLLRTNSFGYDSDGRLIAATNAAQETVSQLWNARSKLLRLTDPASHSVLRAYDAAGDGILLTNRNSNVYQFGFDAANRPSSTATPMGRQTTQVWNNCGLLRSVADPMHRASSYGYDALGRLTNRTDTLAATSYGHDADGNPTSISESNAFRLQTVNWTYDAYDRVSTYTDAAGNTIAYHYNANGNVTNLIYPGNRTVSYAYDNLNRLTNVTDWSSRQTSFTYDLASRLTGITRANGTLRLINYDAGGEVTNIVEAMTSGAPICQFLLGWTNSGRLSWEFAGPLPHPYSTPLRTMTCDSDNRLSSFKGPTMGSAQTVGTDTNGNMTLGPVTNDTYVSYNYDARNRLTNVAGLSYAYDPSGNRSALTNAGSVVQYVVNPNGGRPEILMRISGGTTTYYIYGAGLLYEIRETAASTNVCTYHFDYRGSTVAITDSGGNLTDRIEYSPYGMTSWRTGTNDTPFLFNGRYGVMTDLNGLLYMRARYYNPYICRFVNPDPAGFAGGLNLYCFANGNPASYLDPFGLCAEGTEGWGGATATWIGQNVVGPLNSVETASTTANFSAYMGGSIIGGLADLLRLGQGTAEATYNAQDGWDVAIGVTQDVGRAAGLTVIVGGGLQGAVEDGGIGPASSPAEETAAGESAIPRGGPCFAAGTQVSTPTGDVDIEDINPGDAVYAYDFDQCKVVEQTVESIRQNFTYHWVEIELDGETVRATKSHPFWVESEKRWYKAVDLEPGMELHPQSGEACVVRSIKVDDLDQGGTTYNFEVAPQHNYFVGRNHVLVHNGPGFIVTANGTVFPVPEGAVGPGPVNSGNGFSFTGGSGGNGLSPQTTGLRIMDPTLSYPNGYGVYMNSATPTAQTVNPYTGRTISPSDPLAHIPCN